MKKFLLLSILISGYLTFGDDMMYKENLQSLSRRKCPDWFEEAKIGMFIHWGPYSNPESQPYRHEFMKAEHLTGENFDPARWVKIAKTAGVKYITFTAKHGGGYAMFNTSCHDWNSVDSGIKKDVLGELSQACSKANMPLIAYYCKDDMFLPQDAPMIYPFKIYDESRFNKIVEQYKLSDVRNNWVEYFHRQVKEIANQYEIAGFWLDGTRLPYNYIKTPELISWLYNNYPNMIINDRIGSSEQRKHYGDFWTYERSYLKPVHILPHKWERCDKLGSGWWYTGKENTNGASVEKLIWDIVDTVSLGGNYSMGVGPKPDGSIQEDDINTLEKIGLWLTTHSEAVYKTKPWTWGYYKSGDNIRFTISSDEKYIYLFVKDLKPGDFKLKQFHSSVALIKRAEFLTSKQKLKWDERKAILSIPRPLPEQLNVTVIKLTIERY